MNYENVSDGLRVNSSLRCCKSTLNQLNVELVTVAEIHYLKSIDTLPNPMQAIAQ